MTTLRLVDATPILEAFSDFRENILPLRDAADEDRGTYDEYDEAYKYWLEDLSGTVARLFSVDYKDIAKTTEGRMP